MSEVSATILAALIGFVGGLVFAYLTYRQKADELFLAGLRYLEKGSQKRNLGIGALQLAWRSRRHREVIASILSNVAVYLLLESGQKDAAHEVGNLRRVMVLLTSRKGLAALDDESKSVLLEALEEKAKNPGQAPGLFLEGDDVKKWLVEVRKA